MNQPAAQLLSPFLSGTLNCPNRVVLAPMTRNRAGVERVPNALMATYYAQRATGGLLVTESIDVAPEAIGYPGTPGLYTPAMVSGWAAVVDAVRQAQPVRAPFFAQLFHTGRVSHPSFRADRSPGVAPSAIAADVQLYTFEGLVPAAVPTELTHAGIRTTIDHYVTAALGALQAGFDGVEINAGNGYLVHQFLADGTNHRLDPYGGTTANRVRFAVELVEAVAGAVGASRVGLRISPRHTTNGVSDSDPMTTFTALTRAISGRGLAYLHVIEPASDPQVTGALRGLFDGPLVVNDGYDLVSGESAIREGRADLVAYGRAFLANPDLPRRFSEGAMLNEADPSTFYGGDHTGYTTYPALG
jgi:N-ethylmaleimide reductase